MQKWKLVYVYSNSCSALFGFDLCLRGICILQLPCHGIYVCTCKIYIFSDMNIFLILFMALIISKIIFYNSNVYIHIFTTEEELCGWRDASHQKHKPMKIMKILLFFATHLDLDCSVLYLFSCGGCYDNFCLRSSSSKYTVFIVLVYFFVADTKLCMLQLQNVLISTQHTFSQIVHT